MNKRMSVILVTVFLIGAVFYNQHRRKDVGVKAVKYMYEFENVDELAGNLRYLRTIMTDDVYDNLTPENEERALGHYLEVSKSSVKVKIVKSTNGIVMYELDSKSISAGRIFIFSYSTNWLGKISKVRELEGRDFY